MKIAIVGPSPVPFSQGGMEVLQAALAQNINSLTNNICELIKLPAKENSFWDIIDSYRSFYTLDLSHFDMVISIKYPAWMLQHENHICYMAHRLRGFYDTFHLLNMPEEVSCDDKIVQEVLKYMEENENPLSLDVFFELIDKLRKNQKSITKDIFTFPNPFIRKLVRYMDDYALSANRIRKFFSISETVKNRKDYFPDGVNVNVVYPPPNMNGSNNGSDNYFFTVSRLDAPKRIDLIIEAFKTVKGNHKLVIAGTGPEEKRLKEIAKTDKRIEFMGFVSDDKLVEYYSKCRAVIFIPYEEDYGLITIEAMKCEKPVITCIDSGGPTEFIVNGETGYMARPFSDDLAAKIQMIIDDEENYLKMSNNCAKKVRDITWENTVKSLLSLDKRVDSINYIVKPTRKKITVTSHFSIFPPRGGGQSRCFNLYKNIAEYHDVEFICMGNHNEKFVRREISKNFIETVVPKTEQQAEAEWNYEKEVGVPVSDTALPLVAHLTPEYQSHLSKSIRNSDIVVVSHPYLFNEVKKTPFNKKLIYEAHNVEYLLKKKIYTSNSKYSRELIDTTKDIESKCCINSQYIMTCSQEDSEMLSSIYNIEKNKFIVVPNGVDCSQIEFTEFEVKKKYKHMLKLQDEFICIFIGSWHPPNIEACDYIYKFALECPEVKFLIIGSVCDAIKKISKPRNVGLMGVVSDEEKNLLYKIADIALNPMTSGSGTNLKMFDYMAAGIPVITTEFGARGIEKNEFLIVSDINEFSKQIKNIKSINFLDLEMARKYIEKDYDWKCISKRLIMALDTID